MARKVEIIVTDDGKIVVLGSVTKGGLNLFEMTDRNFDIPSMEDAFNVASAFLEPDGALAVGQTFLHTRRR